MKLFLIETSQGCLERNTGTEKAPEKIAKDIPFKRAEIKKSDFEQTNQNLEKLSGKTNGFFLGGDHSITYPLFKGFAKRVKKKKLIVFDAHADAYQLFYPPSHEDYLRALIEEQIVEPENVLIIGLRKIFPREKKFLSEKKIKTIKADEIRKDFEKAKKILEKFLAGNESIYLSIDVDVFDPGIAPGTFYREKNGLSEKEFIELIELIPSRRIKCIDLTEANPKLDEKNRTINLCNRITQLLIERAGAGPIDFRNKKIKSLA